ncbi:methionine synthase [Tessaracoccus sp. MC1627]|uniref:methionine synthase n=1 Tax=Tessaracoccus sp. MC1627 TaxID=2760312 RepID=UPI001602C069|nr:methionine synthase [Tessaracoccus sp. MC1627]MBB1513879.1 methionine synthase [Tessaracoccus sp. MC1627]MBB1513889.1 methionine synthase [Tessaracoccus sp. MC1627]
MLITAAGSLPGTDFRGALAAMAETLPEVLPLPELPERGVGSDMIGRALGLISGLGFDVQPAGWRLSPHSGAEHRRARAQWRQDLDDTEELLQGFDGVLKVGVAGPWTLASSVERPMGDRVLADHGARRELAQALAEAVSGLRAEVSRRVPGATLWLQVDEPSMIAVAEGRVPTASGFSRHRRVDLPGLVEALRPLADGAWLHCCAPGRWLEVSRRAGFTGASVDGALVDLDELAQWRDEGRGLILGVVDTARGPQSTDELVRAALKVLRAIQVDSLEGLHLGTACGMSGWRRDDVVPQMESLRKAASLVEESLSRG